MKTYLAKLVGNPSSTCWTQVYEFKPTDASRLERYGHLLAVISIKEKKADGVDLGRRVITRLQEEYFENELTSAFSGLKNAVEKIRSEFGESSVQIAAVVVLGKVVYSITCGGSSVAIFRSNSVATILESDEVALASGYPERGDVLILLTKRGKSFVSRGELRHALEQGDIGDAVDYLLPRVHSSDVACEMGVVFLKFGRESKSLGQPALLKVRLGLAGIVGVLLDKLPKKGLYIKKGERSLETPKRGVAILIGGILIVLLFVSVLFGLRRRMAVEEKERYRDRLVQAQHNFDESLALFDLNPERARELFSESYSLVEEIIGESVNDKSVDDLKAKLDSESSRILGEFEVSPETFVDLGLLASGFKGDDLAFSEGNLLVLDRSGKKLARVVVKTKRSEIIGGPKEIEEPVAVAAYETEAYVQEKAAVYLVDGDALKLFEVDEDILIYAYAANLYILNKSDGKIYRHSRVGSEFAPGKNWFGSGVEPDLSNAASWAIDGSVWVLSDVGDILKFVLGRPDVYRIKGVNPKLTKPVQIYTDEDLDGVYVLEPEKSRVVVLDKKGQFVAQYKGDVFSGTVDIAVIADKKTLIALTGSELQSIKLSHLE